MANIVKDKAKFYRDRFSSAPAPRWSRVEHSCDIDLCGRGGKKCVFQRALIWKMIKKHHRFQSFLQLWIITRVHVRKTIQCSTTNDPSAIAFVWNSLKQSETAAEVNQLVMKMSQPSTESSNAARYLQEIEPVTSIICILDARLSCSPSLPHTLHPVALQLNPS